MVANPSDESPALGPELAVLVRNHQTSRLVPPGMELTGIMAPLPAAVNPTAKGSR